MLVRCEQLAGVSVNVCGAAEAADGVGVCGGALEKVPISVRGPQN